MGTLRGRSIDSLIPRGWMRSSLSGCLLFLLFKQGFIEWRFWEEVGQEEQAPNGDMRAGYSG